MKGSKKHFEMFNEEDLKNLAPGLSAISKENPFVVPEGYFDALPDQVMHQIQALPDLESVSSVNPFAVPEGYFESLPTIIQQRIIDSKNVPAWRERLVETLFGSRVFSLRPILAFASVALVVFFGVNYLTRTISVEQNTAFLTATELSNSNYLYEIDESLLVDAMSDQSNDNASTTDKSAEDYLLENNIDLNSLTEQL